MSQYASSPKVTVVMITYNHETYIEQAIRSVLAQEVDFHYELIIGEDYSTDKTRDIVIRLQAEFPEKIKLILQPKNVGMSSNFVDTFNEARGKYIAILEGDDYWINKNKLQLQVNHMDKNPTCRICTHDANVVNSDGLLIKTAKFKSINNLVEYFETDLFIPTSSLLFKSATRQLPSWFREFKAACDWQLHVWLLMQGGSVCHLNCESLANHRVHIGGVASFMLYSINELSETEKNRKAITRIKNIIHDQEVMMKYVPTEAKGYLQSNIQHGYETLARRSYGVDRKLFQTAYSELCKLSPKGKYIPAHPRYLSMIARFSSYPTAEKIAAVYRNIIPTFLRRYIYRRIG